MLLEKSFCCSVGLVFFFSHRLWVFEMVVLFFFFLVSPSLSLQKKLHQVWTLFKSWPNMDETISVRPLTTTTITILCPSILVDCVCACCTWFLIKIEWEKNRNILANVRIWVREWHEWLIVTNTSLYSSENEKKINWVLFLFHFKFKNKLQTPIKCTFKTNNKAYFHTNTHRRDRTVPYRNRTMSIYN